MPEPWGPGNPCREERIARAILNNEPDAISQYLSSTNVEFIETVTLWLDALECDPRIGYHREAAPTEKPRSPIISLSDIAPLIETKRIR